MELAAADAVNAISRGRSQVLPAHRFFFSFIRTICTSSPLQKLRFGTFWTILHEKFHEESRIPTLAWRRLTSADQSLSHQAGLTWRLHSVSEARRAQALGSAPH